MTFASITQTVYERLCQMYWVLSEDNQPAKWFEWVMSKEQPTRKMRPNTCWRRPTMSEAIDRQVAYLTDKKEFGIRCGQFSKRFHSPGTQRRRTDWGKVLKITG